MSTKTRWRVCLYSNGRAAPSHPPAANKREREKREAVSKYRAQHTAHTGPLGKDEALGTCGGRKYLNAITR